MSKKIIFMVFSLLMIGVDQVSAISPPSDQIVNLIEKALSYGTEPTISLGYIIGDKSSYYVYQADQVSQEGPQLKYEVGSITKTLTASMIAQAVDEGLVQLDQAFSYYLPSPSINSSENAPTIQQLLTHQSGYPTLFDNDIIIENIRLSLNPYYGVTKDMLLGELEAYSSNDSHNSFEYSNVNAAVLGLVLEAVYQQPYDVLASDFIQEELALENTHFIDATTDSTNHWEWSSDDAYLPAVAMISTVEDMLAYSRLQLDNRLGWVEESHQLLAEGVAATTNGLLQADYMAYHWFYDESHDVYWHDGGTGGYTSYIALNIDKEVAVVVLSNIPMDEGIPANIIGSQFMNELLQ